MLEETLRAEAQVLRDMVSTHDTADFMMRLAARIEQQEDHSRTSLNATRTAEAADATPGPPSYTTQPQRSTRPAARRSLRRRPAPSRTADVTAADPAVLLQRVKCLCETVLRDNDVVTHMAAFDRDYDEEGARVFACLLYILDRRDSALYWWRFAAGAGDPLAAHLLAVYHAAVGPLPDARVWYAFARFLGYRGEEHRPQPLCVSTASPQRLRTHVPASHELQRFVERERLPDALLPEALLQH
jgi:hypothetical protein